MATAAVGGVVIEGEAVVETEIADEIAVEVTEVEVVAEVEAVIVEAVETAMIEVIVTGPAPDAGAWARPEDTTEAGARAG